MLRKVSLVIFVFLLQVILISTATADKKQPYTSNIEMYGTSEQLADKLMKKYDKQLRTLYQAMLSNPNKPDYMENHDLADQLYHSITSDLMKEGYFSFVNISHIFYPVDNTAYITVDVVDKNDNEIRNSFSQPLSEIIKDKSGLITSWLAYEKKSWELLRQGKISAEITNCPVYHCVFGFENKALRNYLSEFNTAEKHEKELVNILTNDADPEKRAAAAFLIGHFNNPKKIIELLTPALDDPDFRVRNDSLRVIISTVLKVEDPELPVPVKKIINAINDPTAAVRNKALLILTEVVKKDKKYHQYVKTNAEQTLVDLLKLKQPNNHDGAFMVLKEISGKNYDQWDIASWEKWVGNS